MAKGQDKRTNTTKTKAKSSFMEKRALKRAKRNKPNSSDTVAGLHK